MAPFEFALTSPVALAAGTVIKISFSGIQDSYYIGINRVYLLGKPGLTVPVATAPKVGAAVIGGGGAAGGAGATETEDTSSFWSTAALPATAVEAAFAKQQAHRDRMLAGITSVTIPGLPGSLTTFGPTAFPVLSTGGSKPTAIVAAAEYGAGRVVIFAHGDFVQTPTGEAKTLFNNCKAWVAQRGSAASVKDSDVIIVSDCGAEDTIVCGMSASQLAAHVHSGGALMIGLCTWGWCQVNGGRTSMGEGCILNDVLYPMGLAFVPTYVSKPPGGFAISDSDPIHSNAWAFLHNFDDIHAKATGAKVKVEEIVLTPDAIVAGSDEKGKIGAALGGPGGWWAPVGEEHWVEVSVPADGRVHGLRLVCANVQSSPRTVSLHPVGCHGAGTGMDWPFVRPAEAVSETTSPISFMLPSPISVKAGGVLRIAFHGIQDSFYIGVNSIKLLGQMEGGNMDGAHTVAAFATALPPSLHPTIADALTQRCKIDAAPSPSTPIPADGRGAIMAAITQLDPSIVHRKGLANFPGAAPATAPRVSLEVDCVPASPEEPEWISSFGYASPGDTVTVTLVGGDYSQYSLRIGCHKDDLTVSYCEAETWLRWPVVTQEVRFTGDNMSITAAHGGLVFLVADAGAAPIHALVEGVVAAPHAGPETGYALVDGDAPWGEFSANHVSFFVKRDVLLAAAAAGRLEAAARFWDRVLSAQHKLSPPPYGARRERVCYDVQISLGLMHSGYPVMVDRTAFNGSDAGEEGEDDEEDAGAEKGVKFEDTILYLDETNRREDHQALWGLFHELGHNHQRSTWTWSATTEVTVNLFTLYAFDTVLGTKPVDALARWNSETAASVAAQLGRFSGHDDSGRPPKYTKWASDPAFALRTFAGLIHRFGWPMVQATMALADNDDAPKVAYTGATTLPKGEQQALDAWVLCGSKVANVNLAPFFKSWGLPVSKEAAEAVAGYPDA